MAGPNVRPHRKNEKAIDEDVNGLIDPNPKTKSRLSMDEIAAMVSDIARDTEAGADRFRALKFAAAMDDDRSYQPEEMDERNLLARLTLIMRGAGVILCQRAFDAAFRLKKHAIEDPAFIEQDAAVYGLPRFPTSLRQLRRMFPEAKVKGGFPRGYPSRGSIAQQHQWLKAEAIKMNQEKMQRQLNDSAINTPIRDTVRDDLDQESPTDHPPTGGPVAS